MFKNNRASGTWGRDQYGGAIYSNGDLRVSNCNFTKNKAKTDGGAIHINNKGLSVIENSKFIDNEAYNKGGAINIDDTSAHVVIKNNSFLKEILLIKMAKVQSSTTTDTLIK